MTTIRSTTSQRQKAEAQPVRAGVVVWLIERQAATAAQPDLDFARRTKKPIELRIAFENDNPPTAELVDTATNHSHPIELTAPRVTFVDAEPYTHIEITAGHETVLSATLRTTEPTTRLLYARTALLTRLNIKGGRYPAPLLSL